MAKPNLIQKGFNFLGRRFGTIGAELTQQLSNVQQTNINQIVRENHFNTSVTWNTSRYTVSVP